MKFVASILVSLVILGLGVLAALYGMVGFAAWSDAQNVCPDGNQCSDAISSMWFGGAVSFLSVAVAVGLTFWLRRMLRV
jgi:hypothetical protein